MSLKPLLGAVVALSLLTAACTDPDAQFVGEEIPEWAEEFPDGVPPLPQIPVPAAPAATAPTQAEEAVPLVDPSGQGYSDEGRSIQAPTAAIVADGDASDWAEVAGVAMYLPAITGGDFPAKTSLLKVAHDDEFVYVLLQVDDDYNWNPADAKLSAASAIQWAVDPAAGEAMGAAEEAQAVSLGMVDIWHWELECAAGEQTGGATSGPGDGNNPGNDEACNFDDEFATTTGARDDDVGDGAENSLQGVWSHSDPTDDAEGTWTFEMRRPLDTGDSTDAQFAVGSTSQVAVAYWDVDASPDGWSGWQHLQSSNQGWIDVEFVEGAGTPPAAGGGGRSVNAPAAAIVTDGDAADWADIAGFASTLTAIGGADFEPKESVLKVAHDDEFIYVLLQVDDDYNWNAADAKLSAASAIQWAVDPAAGAAMGAAEDAQAVSLGMVDIWHWELECAAGEQTGGATSGPGDGDAGNDDACNFDDEFATDTSAREDDNAAGAENSLQGVWSHSAPSDDSDGTWTFEMQRPLNTGDSTDAQFEIGSSAQVALAYWDVDSSPDGWQGWQHLQSSSEGWITVNFG